MNPETIQQIIELIQGAGEGARELVIAFLCFEYLTPVVITGTVLIFFWKVVVLIVRAVKEANEKSKKQYFQDQRNEEFRESMLHLAGRDEYDTLEGAPGARQCHKSILENQCQK